MARYPHLLCAALLRASAALKAPGAMADKAVGVLVDIVAEEVVPYDEFPLLSDAVRLLTKRVTVSFVQKALGTAALDSSARVCDVLAVLVCPAPDDHRGVLDATKGLLRDTAKSEALAEHKRWFKDRLLVDDPREAA